MNNRTFARSGVKIHIAYATALLLLSFTAGCNTLSSLGLPLGASSNRLMVPAKVVSEAPKRAILTSKELAKQPLDIYIVLSIAARRSRLRPSLNIL